jgi:thiamine biosynthesis lipoprotein
MVRKPRRTLGLAILALTMITALTVSARGEALSRPVMFRTQTMGTWASLTLVTADSAAVAKLAYESLVVLHHVDSLMSNWTDTSEIARINRDAGEAPIAINSEVADVLGYAQAVSHASDGAFDITVEPLVRLWGFLGGTPAVPTQAAIDAVLQRIGYELVRFNAADGTVAFTREDLRIDLGGIAKGYGVDRVAALLGKTNTTDALVNLSGNMVAIGAGASGNGWVVGIRDPKDANAYIARLRLHDEAIATSGDYEQFVDADGRRHGHILDPRTGWSALGLTSVTVVAASAMTADAWATALFVLGPERAKELAGAREDLSVVLVAPAQDGGYVIWAEETLRSRFSQREDIDLNITVEFF